MSLRAVEPGELRSLLQAVRDGTFDWTVDGLAPLFDQLGWAVLEHKVGRRMLVATPWGFHNAIVLLRYRDDMVNAMTIFLSGDAPMTHEGYAAVQDAFVATVEQATSVLGPATDTEPGSSPKVAWRDARQTFILQNAGLGLVAAWDRTPYHDQLKRDAAALS